LPKSCKALNDAKDRTPTVRPGADPVRVLIAATAAIKMATGT
jgi:hypothetical protein